MEYAAHRLVVGFLNVLPEGWALSLGGALGWIVGVIFRFRWRTVMDQLRIAFPEEDEKWRRNVARASFRHVGRQSVATFRIGRLGIAGVRERTDMFGYEAMREAWAEGKGLIVSTGHFGNWEVGGASISAHGIPCNGVVQRQRNPLFDADLAATRARLGYRAIERKSAPKEVLRVLRKGGAVGFVGDQNIRRGGVFVDFFGKPAATARGTALFALRTGSPIFVGVAKSVPGVPQRYHVTFEPVDFSPTGDMDADVLELTRLHTKLLEKRVREAPEQYFWQHRRWKTQPPGSPDP